MTPCGTERGGTPARLRAVYMNSLVCILPLQKTFNTLSDSTHHPTQLISGSLGLQWLKAGFDSWPEIEVRPRQGEHCILTTRTPGIHGQGQDHDPSAV